MKQKTSMELVTIFTELTFSIGKDTALPQIMCLKMHDRHAMQHFTTNKLVYLEGYMNEYFPEDIPLGHIARLHHHSNNAGQYFKILG